MAKKRSKVYLDTVDQFIIDEMLDGATPTQIITQLMTPTWGYLTVANARKAISRVREKMADNNRFSIEEKISEYKEMYKYIYKQCKDAAEWRTANQVMDSLVKLESLTVTKVDAKIENDIVITFD